MVTLRQMRDCADAIALTSNLLDNNSKLPESLSEQEYYGSWSYHSKIYRCIYRATQEERSAIYYAIHTGKWLLKRPEKFKGQYLTELNKQNLKTPSCEKLCVMLLKNKHASTYLKTVLIKYFNEKI